MGVRRTQVRCESIAFDESSTTSRKKRETCKKAAVSFNADTAVRADGFHHKVLLDMSDEMCEGDGQSAAHPPTLRSTRPLSLWPAESLSPPSAGTYESEEHKEGLRQSPSIRTRRDAWLITTSAHSGNCIIPVSQSFQVSLQAVGCKGPLNIQSKPKNPLQVVEGFGDTVKKKKKTESTFAIRSFLPNGVVCFLGVFSFACSSCVCPVANDCVRRYELEELSGDGVLVRSNKGPTRVFNLVRCPGSAELLTARSGKTMRRTCSGRSANSRTSRSDCRHRPSYKGLSKIGENNIPFHENVSKRIPEHISLQFMFLVHAPTPPEHVRPKAHSEEKMCVSGKHGLRVSQHGLGVWSDITRQTASARRAP